MRLMPTLVVLASLACPALAQVPATQPPAAPARPPAGAPPSATPPAATPPAATPPAATPPATAPRAAAPAPTTAAPAPPSEEKLDLNLATAAELEAALPGIGAARSAAIVQHRPYRTPEEVVAKASIPQAVFNGIRDRVTATQINVNTASARDMIAVLPGVGDARAAGIVRGRPYRSLDELVSKGGLPQSVLDRVRPALVLR